jgi:glycosyltransferase involved in cell wall biosynthesis
LLLEVNSPLAEERAAFGDLHLGWMARACESALWNGADAALAVTEVLAEKVRETRRTPGGVHVIPNGAHLDPRVDIHRSARLRHDLGLPPDALVLGFVGFVRAWHGVGWALEAMAQLPPQTHLVIVGDGPALPQLAARAHKLGLERRVHLPGRVAHDEVAGYMQLFDVALQTAAVAYASPLKLFEYMALGSAIIAPDQPNIREILTDGETAQLFSPASEASFRDALCRLCAEPSLRVRLGEAAQRAVRDTPYTWAQNAVRIEGIARGLIKPAAEAVPRYAASPA